MPAISTPCIDVCVVEPATGLCVGCGRTLDEIARWSSLDEARRRSIMAALPARFVASGAGDGPPPLRRRH